jgi:antirestriction protein
MSDDSLNDLIPSNNPSNIDAFVPRIYVACLAAYNNGWLHGKWIEAAQEVEIIQKEIQKMLIESPIAGAGEFAIHDFEDFGSLSLDEYESIKTVQSKAMFISTLGELGAELLAYCGDLESAQEALENYYHGEYENELGFATQLFEECYLSSAPEAVSYYIDYEMFKRDIFINDYFSLDAEGKCHVFSRY